VRVEETNNNSFEYTADDLTDATRLEPTRKGTRCD
jgi:hypothetical protein